ncbi:hypothetical protein SAMN02745911_1899 [Aureimonas altamirensis DSM 21988]|uniref:Uncharacterized protein n=1 Tax=Aureimonas altamirensis DSM 21988 TaxID=1121026 RepID=A0ABY1IH85_9HYPH|nr:hypothetical protein [Aureimonas altamirensis]SHJ17203.1 hypothetical protein SAMN02745911_1899 [Aureimonas altamirensis DSM 21988]
MSEVNRVERETEEENRFRSDKVERETPSKVSDGEEACLDNALDDTFPASDPVPPKSVE